MDDPTSRATVVYSNHSDPCGSLFSSSGPEEEAVLPDDLDQLPLRKVLITVILTTVNVVEVCNKA